MVCRRKTRAVLMVCSILKSDDSLDGEDEEVKANGDEGCWIGLISVDSGVSREWVMLYDSRKRRRRHASTRRSQNQSKAAKGKK